MCYILTCCSNNAIQPADYKKIGVNVYYGGVDSYPSPRGKAWLDALQKEGMYGIIGYSDEGFAENGWPRSHRVAGKGASPGGQGTTGSA